MNDICEINKTREEILNVKNFEKWRNEIIKAFDIYFNLKRYLYSINDEEIRKFIREFYQCMYRFTNQIYKCNKTCVDASFNDIHFFNKFIDTNERMKLSDKYMSCNMYGIQIIDGIMYEIKDLVDNLDIFSRLEKTIENACQNNFESDSFLCLTYEIKDICKKNGACIQKYFLDRIPHSCIIKNQKNQFNILMNLSGLLNFRSDKKNIENTDKEYYENSKKPNDNVTSINAEAFKSDFTSDDYDFDKIPDQNPSYSDIRSTMSTQIPLDFSRGEMTSIYHEPIFSIKKLDINKKKIPEDHSRGERSINFMITESNFESETNTIQYSTLSHIDFTENLLIGTAALFFITMCYFFINWIIKKKNSNN